MKNKKTALNGASRRMVKNSVSDSEFAALVAWLRTKTIAELDFILEVAKEEIGKSA